MIQGCLKILEITVYPLSRLVLVIQCCGLTSGLVDRVLMLVRVRKYADDTLW